MSSRSDCRVCGKRLSDPFVDLGVMPLANAFPARESEFAVEPAFPLAVCLCSGCGLAQLNYVVPAEQLYRDYIYVSSTSEAVRAYAQRLARTFVDWYHLTPSDLVVEIASNDGTVLRAFQDHKLRVLGVEPAKNIAALAAASGIPTIADFFCEDAARRMVDEYGRVAVILARHVFAHIDDLHDFLRGICRLLSDDGLFVIEVPYLGDLIENLEFDTIYHEHLSYFGLAPLVRVCEQHSLRVVDVERVSLHGGSMLVYIRKQASTSHVSANMQRMMREEISRQFCSRDRLVGFARDVGIWKRRFETIVEDVVRAGAVVIGYGAAAKGNTLLNYCPDTARTLSCIMDRSPHKQGRFTPGTHRPVVPVDTWPEHQATHMLILAWNFKEEIVRQMKPFADEGGRFIIPLPEPVVL